MEYPDSLSSTNGPGGPSKVFQQFDVLYKDVTVLDNELIRITSSSVYFFQLRLGNNAKIIIDESAGACNLRIDNFIVGDNCQIVGDGSNGKSAPISNPKDPWNSGWWQASTGHNGDIGVPGLSGEPGNEALPLGLTLGIISIGSISVHANGGDGGNGGNGGKGQIGGNKNDPFTTCGRGGNGGGGGDAGRGGSGANIIVDVFAGNDTVDVSKALQFISVAAHEGSDGIVGVGGRGGEGGNDCLRGGRGGHGGFIGNLGTKGQTELKGIPFPGDIHP